VPESDALVSDPEQDAVAESGEPVLVVAAGPGSGKTRTLTRRAGTLLARDPDSSALLLTFTNRAAAELKARSLREINTVATRILACNYHSFGQIFLRAHGSLVGITPDFEVIDDDDAAEFAQQASEATGITDQSAE